MSAQIEEILEKNWYPGGLPTCLVKNEGGYSALPLVAPGGGEQKP